MTTGLIHDQNLEKQIEKQMGCMAGFLQIFDRHQILNGKRIYTAKRIPYPVSDSASDRTMDSPTYSSELRPQERTKQSYMRSLPVTPESLRSPAPEVPAKTPTHLPVFEFKEGFRSSWKFKEAPRLSLDSRAVVDGKGKLYPKENRTNAAAILSGRSKNGEESEKQKRSPSVIAKLMGLEALPESGREPLQKAELRRSASESRVSRDLQFVDGNGHGDGNSFQIKYQKHQSFPGNFARDNAVKGRTPDLKGFSFSKPNTESQKDSRGGFGPGVANASSWKLQQQQQQQQQRKSYFDAQDVFPEPRQTESLYGEIEKRLKMRGIDEPAKDLETLKQILEALQLKGLLHSNRTAAEQIRNRNIITDRKFSYEESPIVLMKPARSNASINHIGRTGTDISPNLRSKPAQPIRLRRDGPEMNRNLQNQRFGKLQNESSDRSPSSLSRKRANDSVQQRKTFSSHSPKTPSTPPPTTSRSPRNRRSTGEISSKESAEDELSTVSESSKSTSSQIDTEGSKMEEYKEGKSLLARCDKLLNSIAEITASNELQPSPVSVLDSSFYKDESSPSPVMKRCIDYKDQYEELNGDNWNPSISPFQLKFDDQSEDSDFLYIYEILRATNCASENTDVFLLIEKHQTMSNSSETFRLHRKLVFDTITEILQKMRDLPPWKAFSGANSFVGKPSLKQIWSEFRRIRERESVAEDLFEVIFGVLRKDMAGDGVNGWTDFQMQTSEAVLDIERLIFKDLIVETIKDLATFSGKNRSYISRRKLVF